MDVLTDVLDRVRLKGTVLFHYELRIDPRQVQ
jgi:hypothetical protein